MFCHTLTLSRSHTLSFNHSPHAEQLLFSWLCSKVTLTLSHSLILSSSLSQHDEQLLFSCLSSKVTFLTPPPSPSPVTLDVIDVKITPNVLLTQLMVEIRTFLKPVLPK